MSVEERKNDIVKRLSHFSSWEDRYRQILHYGKKLEPLQEEFKTEEKLVRGCLSKVWLHHELRDGKVFYSADSDAAITKGIIALLVNVYSGGTPEEILGLSTDFLKEVGVTDHLSMNRRNGLVNMCKLIHLYAEESKA